MSRVRAGESLSGTGLYRLEPLMFEVQHRDGLARVAEWSSPQFTARTPLILYAATDRLPPPEGAEVLLSKGGPGDRPFIQDLGSVFAPAEPDPGAAITIPAELPYPQGFDPRLDALSEEVSARARPDGGVLVGERAAVAREGSREAVVVLAAARALARDPRALADALPALREAAGPGSLLYAPGAGLPCEIALFAYAGVDLFDSVPVILSARRGEFLTPEGPLPSALLETLPCACGACARGERGFEPLLRHNYAVQRAELLRVREAIRLGALRELVEARARAAPELAAFLRILDLDRHPLFESRAPVNRTIPMLATGKESLQRPEIVRFRRRLADRYRKPASARVLLLVPCSATKPYSGSRTHAILDRALSRVRHVAAVHRVVVTSPLGVVPMELEHAYPAARYDLPVTGHWDKDEAAMLQDSLAAILRENAYDATVVHLEESQEALVAPALGKHESTGGDDPLSPKSLERLVAAVEPLTAGARVAWPTRVRDDLASLARWQFGIPGERLAEGAAVRGRYPHLKLFADGKQLAQLVPDRGMLALTLDGAQRLSAPDYTVEIDDFLPRGAVYAAGVREAGAALRPQDEAVLTHEGEVRGVGIAAMSAAEMNARIRGIAVKVRHHG